MRMAFVIGLIGVGAVTLAIKTLDLFSEMSFSTGFRIPPLHEWWLRFKAHGFDWRRYP